MLIFNEATGILPKKIQDKYDEHKIIIKANKKGWMNQKLLDDWIEEIWRPNLLNDESYLLIWDSLAPHKTKKKLLIT